MQIEPPETIHFPIHSLQELQEQRGGLRVSALGPPRCSRLLELPKAFEIMDLSKASASVSFL